MQGGLPPYRIAVAVAAELPDEYIDVARPDGWVVKAIDIPATTKPGTEPVRVGIQDANGDKLVVQGVVKVASPGTK